MKGLTPKKKQHLQTLKSILRTTIHSLADQLDTTIVRIEIQRRKQRPAVLVTGSNNITHVFTFVGQISREPKIQDMIITLDTIEDLILLRVSGVKVKPTKIELVTKELPSTRYNPKESFSFY